jgi:hypothetical protein
MSAATLWQSLRSGHLTPTAKIHEPKRNPPTAVESVLCDAERFLYYVTSTGKSVDPKIRDPIITARMELANGALSKERISELYEAYSFLAAAAKPVTAETIWACRHLALGALKRYRTGVLCLTFTVIGLCMASFMFSALTQKIGDDITEANKLAVKLTAELGPLPEARDLKTQLTLARELAHATDEDGAAKKAISAGDSSKWKVLPGLTVTEVIADLQQFTALSPRTLRPCPVSSLSNKRIRPLSCIPG